MENTTKDRLTIRIDHDRKQRAAVIAESMGTDLPNLVNMFLAQVITDNGLPFRPTQDHYERAIDEALKDVKNGDVRTSSADDFFKRLHEIERDTDD